MSINKGLGRGLDALFNGAAKSAEDVAPQKLPINEIMPNPAQPRRYFIDQSLQELADSILAQGILQPILVRPMEGGKSGRFERGAGNCAFHERYGGDGSSSY